MRLPFAHDALVQMAPGGDPSALGAAITVALCGHWTHEPPCPLAPHHTETRRHGDEVRVRVLFATLAGKEAGVRRQIEAALADGRLTAEGAGDTQWQLLSCGPAALRPNEFDHGQRLVQS